MSIISAVIGALVGVFALILWERYQGPRRLLRALRAELAANRKLCQDSLPVNRSTLDAIPPVPDGAPAPTIDDDLKVFVSSPINIPISTWVNQDFWWIFRAIPIESLIEYKAAVARVEFLVDRHRGFRFRPNFVSALIAAHERLLQEIDRLEPMV